VDNIGVNEKERVRRLKRVSWGGVKSQQAQLKL